MAANITPAPSGFRNVRDKYLALLLSDVHSQAAATTAAAPAGTPAWTPGGNFSFPTAATGAAASAPQTTPAPTWPSPVTPAPTDADVRLAELTAGLVAAGDNENRQAEAIRKLAGQLERSERRVRHLEAHRYKDDKQHLPPDPNCPDCESRYQPHSHARAPRPSSRRRHAPNDNHAPSLQSREPRTPTRHGTHRMSTSVVSGRPRSTPLPEKRAPEHGAHRRARRSSAYEETSTEIREEMDNVDELERLRRERQEWLIARERSEKESASLSRMLADIKRNTQRLLRERDDHLQVIARLQDRLSDASTGRKELDAPSPPQLPRTQPPLQTSSRLSPVLPSSNASSPAAQVHAEQQASVPQSSVAFRTPPSDGRQVITRGVSPRDGPSPYDESLQPDRPSRRDGPSPGVRDPQYAEQSPQMGELVHNQQSPYVRQSSHVVESLYVGPLPHNVPLPHHGSGFATQSDDGTVTSSSGIQLQTNLNEPQVMTSTPVSHTDREAELQDELRLVLEENARLSERVPILEGECTHLAQQLQLLQAMLQANNREAASEDGTNKSNFLGNLQRLVEEVDILEGVADAIHFGTRPDSTSFALSLTQIDLSSSRSSSPVKTRPKGAAARASRHDGGGSLDDVVIRVARIRSSLSIRYGQWLEAVGQPTTTLQSAQSAHSSHSSHSSQSSQSSRVSRSSRDSTSTPEITSQAMNTKVIDRLIAKK